MFRLPTRALAFAAGLLAAGPVAAQSISSGCQWFIDQGTRDVTGLVSQPNLTFVAGDTVSIVRNSGDNLQNCGVDGLYEQYGARCDNFGFKFTVTPTTTRTALLESLGTSNVTTTCTPSRTTTGGSTGGSTGGGGTGGGTTTGGGTPTTPTPAPRTIEELRQELLRIASQAQGGSGGPTIGQQIRSAISAFFNPTVSTRNPLSFGHGQVTFSTQGLGGRFADRSFDGFVQATYRDFDGTIEGDGVGLTFGGHVALGRAVLGLAVTWDEIDVTTGAATLESRTLMAGPYFGLTFGDGLTLDGHVLYGEPEYDYGAAGTADGERLSYGLTLSGRRPLGARSSLAPYATLSGYEEDIGAGGGLAAREVSRSALTLGARIDMAPREGLATYVDLGLEGYSFDDGTTSDEDVSPHLGAGVAWSVGGGQLRLDGTASEIADGARSYSVGLGYQLKF